MASILDRIRRAFVTGDVVPNTSRETVPPSRPSLFYEQFAAAQGRLAVIRECREMYRTDPRAKAALGTLARDVVKTGFVVSVTAGPRAEEAAEIAAATIRRLKLDKHLAPWIRMSARDGDSVLELGISAAREIVEVTRKPVLQMIRLSDEFDRFPNPDKAFAWGDPASISLDRIPDDAVTFAEFQIVHARWDHDSESRYGSPEFESALGAWKYVREGERDIAIRRKTRAGMLRQHKLEGASAAELEEYKEANRDALDNPFAAISDYFINFPGGIENVEGDPNLGDIADIEHHLQTWSAASSVPLELLAYGANLNRDVLGDKREQYAETLAQIREWAADEIILPIVERQWLLAGIFPESYTYHVVWPQKAVLAPEHLKALGDAVTALLLAGWSKGGIWAAIEPFMPPEITADMVWPAAAEANEDGADDDGRDEGANATVEAATEAMRLAHLDTTLAVRQLLTRLQGACSV